MREFHYVLKAPQKRMDYKFNSANSSPAASRPQNKYSEVFTSVYHG